MNAKGAIIKVNDRSSHQDKKPPSQWKCLEIEKINCAKQKIAEMMF
jgi:hypothetical protein